MVISLQFLEGKIIALQVPMCDVQQNLELT